MADFALFQQLKYINKREVENNLRRIGKSGNCLKFPIKGSAKTIFTQQTGIHFSNPLARTFEEMNAAKEFDTMNAVIFIFRVCSIKCWISPCGCRTISKTKSGTKSAVMPLQNNLTFFDLRVRKSFCAPWWFAPHPPVSWWLFWCFHEDKTEREKLLQHIADKFPEITSLLYTWLTPANDTITDQEWWLSKATIAFMNVTQAKIGSRNRPTKPIPEIAATV